MTYYPKHEGVKTSYLHRVYHVPSFIKTFDSALKVAKQLAHSHPFDAIAFTGTSGAAYAYPLSYHLQIPLLCIRKSETNNHYGQLLEGAVEAKRYLIVDDWVATGKTINRIVSTIRSSNYSAEFAAALLYDMEDSKFKSDRNRPVTVAGLYSSSVINIPYFGARLPEEEYRDTEKHKQNMREAYAAMDSIENGYPMFPTLPR